MKKILSVLAIALMSTALFAKTWTNNAGFGFTLPISSITSDNEDVNDFFQIGYGIQGFYLGYHENGFTVKAAESAGLATSKDFYFPDNDTHFGVFNNIEVGLGYTFIKNNRVTLSLLGMLGLDLSVYSDSEDDTDVLAADNSTTVKGDYTISIGTALFSVGGDLFVSCKLKPNLGLFCNISGRYLVAGKAFGEQETKYKTGDKTITSKEDFGDRDLNGKFRIQPTIGLVWTF